MINCLKGNCSTTELWELRSLKYNNSRSKARILERQVFGVSACTGEEERDGDSEDEKVEDDITLED